MIKALFFDIDGTLVSFSTHRIPQSAVDALSAAKSRGVQIFISTGRPWLLINNLGPLQERGLIDGYITMNGACCFAADGTPISKMPISRSSAETILHYTWERNIPCVVVGSHDACVCRLDRQLRDLFYRHLQCPVTFDDVTVDEALSRGDIYQMSPFLDMAQEAELHPAVPDCEMGRWHPAFVDVTARGCTKQKGIDDIARHFGIALEETMSFGDGGNDIPMLRHAHTGVAMGNAQPEVKAAADYVTASVDDEGVALALCHFGVI